MRKLVRFSPRATSPGVNAIDSEPTAEVLLHRFVKGERAGESFRRLVEQQSGLVLSTATRQLGGDRALAEDVSQEVFKLLARKAAKLDGKVSVAGWLYRQTCRQSLDRLRSESRRRKREEHAQDLMNSKNDPPDPALIAEIDQALLSLPEKSRDAVIMRFMEGRSHQSVGKQLGLSDEAARKRIERGLESLKSFLGARGIKTSTTILATSLAALTTNSAKASTIAQIASFALQPATLKTGTLSLSALAAGFLATSAVAVGLRVANQNSENTNPSSVPITESQRHLHSQSTRNSLIPPTRKTDSFEDIIAAMKELSRRPQHEITRFYFENLLAQISDEEISEFVEASKNTLSRAERDKAYSSLLRRWSESDPKAALDFAFYEGVSSLLRERSFLISDLAYRWASLDFSEAFRWVLSEWSHPNWEAIQGRETMIDGRLRSGPRPNVLTVAEDLLRKLRSKETMAFVLNEIETLPKDAKYTILSSLSDTPWHTPTEQIELAQFLHTLDQSPKSQALRHIFWHRVPQLESPHFDQRDQQALDKIFESLTPPAQYKARLAMINLPQHGESLSQVFEAGRALQLGEGDIAKDLAESYLAAPFRPQTHDLEISNWINENASHLNLDEAIRQRIGRGNDRVSGWVDENKEANAMLLSLSLSDREEAHRQARHHFENLLLEMSSEVPYFLRIFPIPEELHQEFVARFEEATPNSND